MASGHFPAGAVAVWLASSGETTFNATPGQPDSGTIVALDSVGSFGSRPVGYNGAFMDFDGHEQPAGPDQVTRGMLVNALDGGVQIDPGNGHQADVEISLSFTDLRNKSDLSEYSGELRVLLGVRITDRYNGTSLRVPATVTDGLLGFSVSCSSTGGPRAVRATSPRQRTR